MLSINHVALTVSDREKAAEFYGQYFGMHKRVHDDEHLLILAGQDGSLLALSCGKAPTGLPRTNHFGFPADSAEQVLTLRQRFDEAGVTEVEFQESGPTRVQVFDPDGYRVEVYAF